MALLGRRTGPSIGILLLLLGVVAAALQARAEAVEEYRLKGAFLYNFAKFVRWPSEALVDRERFTICLIGESSVADQLSEVVAGKTVQELLVAVEHLSAPSDASGCHILFVAGVDLSVDRVAETTAGAPVLTVGEAEEFAEKGGMIGFAREGNSLRFEINKRVAEEAGLFISSKLLKLASVVHE